MDWFSNFARLPPLILDFACTFDRCLVALLSPVHFVEMQQNEAMEGEGSFQLY